MKDRGPLHGSTSFVHRTLRPALLSLRSFTLALSFMVHLSYMQTTIRTAALFASSLLLLLRWPVHYARHGIHGSFWRQDWLAPDPQIKRTKQ